MRASVMEIDLSNFKYNIEQIQNFVGKNIILMPVIKANAYGTYLNEYIEYIKNFEIVAVAFCTEAISLRRLGFKNKILVLNQPDVLDIKDIISNDISVGVSDRSFLESLANDKAKVSVHIEIETGMGRTGISINDLKEYIRVIKDAKNIQVEGVYTHFSVADCDEDYTNLQIEKFNKAVSIIKEEFGDIRYIHSSASNRYFKF